jgi:hypothetical protein
MDYVKDLRAGTLPPNIEVQEFFMKTGDYLGNAPAQQAYISTNYTYAARDMAVQGLNVIAQAVASQGARRQPAAEPVEQPRYHRGSHRMCARQWSAGDGRRRDQPANALHAQWCRSGPRLF